MTKPVGLGYAHCQVPVSSHPPTEAQVAHLVERSACPSCGGTGYKTLYSTSYLDPTLWRFLRGYYSGVELSEQWVQGCEYRLDECRACTLVFQRFVPDAEFLDVIYDVWLNSSYRPEEDPTDREAMAQPLWSRDGHELLCAAQLLGRDITQLKILDYGMGWALWSRVARRIGVRNVFGFDLSAARRQYAEAYGIQVLPHADIVGLGLDFINTEQVFEHLDAPAEVASVLAQGLRTGGILKISVPRARKLRQRLQVLDWHAPSKTRYSLNPVHPFEHLNCWNPRALDTLARQLGLEPIIPPLRSSYAFLLKPESVPIGSLKQLAKSVLRPAYNQLSSHNLYRWFRRV